MKLSSFDYKDRKTKQDKKEINEKISLEEMFYSAYLCCFRVVSMSTY